MQTLTTYIEENIAFIHLADEATWALSVEQRVIFLEHLADLAQQSQVKVIILHCQGRDFYSSKKALDKQALICQPSLNELINAVASYPKPIVALLAGQVLADVFSLALACHYRFAVSATKVGFPEVALGLLPSAAAAPRLMHLLGAEASIAMMFARRFQQVDDVDNGLWLEDVVMQDRQLKVQAVLFAQGLMLNNRLIPPVFCLYQFADNWHKTKQVLLKKHRGKLLPQVLCQLLEQSAVMTIEEILQLEQELIEDLLSDQQSKALAYAKNIELQVTTHLPESTHNNVNSLAIIGAGTMGASIATCFLMAGFPVLLIEQSSAALALGVERIKDNLDGAITSGHLEPALAKAYFDKLDVSIDYQALANVDLVIEAVFEDIAIKQSVFARVSRICPPETLLVSNTSYLDINTLATSVTYPEQFLGMHFFSPAHKMKLVEVIKAEHTSEQAMTQITGLAKQLNKLPIQAGVCFGFAANRMYSRYGREIQQMLLEGAKVAQIDNAMQAWGMAMGPLAVQDLSGIDIGDRARSTQAFPLHDRGYFQASSTMVKAQRLGRKTQAGFYDYDQQGRRQVADEVNSLLQKTADELAISQHCFTDEEIVHRALLAMISAGLGLLKDNIVSSVAEIDLIWLHGYGFPRYQGGPMFQAQQKGALWLMAALAELAEEFGEEIWPTFDQQVSQLNSIDKLMVN